jgi:hypothetical protein
VSEITTLETQPVGIGGVRPEVANYSAQEVDSLRLTLGKVGFQAPEGTVAKLLTRAVKRLWVDTVDSKVNRESKGRVGGNVVEYWLNDDRVLRVATAYYSVGNKHFNLEEWAVILGKSERD